MTRQVRHPLFHAWHTHWSILFSDAPNRETALREWVISSLVQFCPDKPFLPKAQIGNAIPEWLDELDVRADVGGAQFGSAQNSQQVAPWFAATPIGWNPLWVGGHADYFSPFERLVGTPTEDKVNYDRWSKESHAALRNVTLRIGKYIERELRFKLRIGHLLANGLHSGTDADMGGVEIVRRLNAEFQLNVLNNSMSGSGNRPQINDLRISQGPFHDRQIKWPHSFKEYDIALFERMEEMLESKQVPSVRKAAEEVAKLALCKGNLDSAIQRLEHGFGHQMNR